MKLLGRSLSQAQTALDSVTGPSLSQAQTALDSVTAHRLAFDAGAVHGPWLVRFHTLGVGRPGAGIP